MFQVSQLSFHIFRRDCPNQLQLRESSGQPKKYYHNLSSELWTKYWWWRCICRQLGNRIATKQDHHAWLGQGNAQEKPQLGYLLKQPKSSTT